jgi:hypothetical protein
MSNSRLLLGADLIASILQGTMQHVVSTIHNSGMLSQNLVRLTPIKNRILASRLAEMGA